MINVGIIGCGFVGGALKDWLEHNNPECKLFITDPAKGYNDDLSNVDIAFLQIHVPTEDDGTQDLTLMKELIEKLPDVPVFVRTTILPGTSERLSKETGHQVCYMPEFLTERTFLEDFRKQTMVFTGAQELLTNSRLCHLWRLSLLNICTMYLVLTKLLISMRVVNIANRWELTGVKFILEFSFQVISTIPIRMYLDQMASSVMAASASLKMSMPSQK